MAHNGHAVIDLRPSRRTRRSLTRAHRAPRNRGVDHAHTIGTPFARDNDAASITTTHTATTAAMHTTPIPGSPTAHLPASAVQHRPDPRRPRRARIIAVANQKGGAGKTSSVLGLAGALAEDGYNVLVVDIDEQANATTGLGVEHTEDGTHFVLTDDEADPVKAIVVTKHDRIHLMPAHPNLAEVPNVLSGPDQFATHAILAEALDKVRDRYDFILIDCPPSLSILTINGLYASDEVFVPVNPGFFDLMGLAKLRTTVKRVRERLKRPDLDIRHVIVINFSANRANSRDTYRDVREAFGDRVIDTAQPDPDKKWYGSGVPNDGKITSSHSAGVPITLYDRRSRAAVAYRVIAAVVSQRSIERS